MSLSERWYDDRKDTQRVSNLEWFIDGIIIGAVLVLVVINFPW